MSEISLKQKAVLASLAVAALYVGAVLFWFLSAESAWKKSARKYEQAKATYQKECRLIAERDRIDEDYEKEKAAMPTFAAGKSTDTTWLQKTGEIAAKNLVQISQRGTQKEKMEIDDVTVLPIDASWEASLEAIVKFMYELENSGEGLFDVAELNFKPSQRRGYLRGSFTVNCAYMRDEEK